MKKLHLTIGIPALNEDANIGTLLSSLLSQRRSAFTLDRIIVMCDGSTDATPTIVRNAARRNRKIACMFDRKQRGVRYRLQQLFSLNSSEIIVFFDADTLPKTADTLDRIAVLFQNRQLALATASLEPLPPHTGFEYTLSCWRYVWHAIIHAWNGGNNIYNFRGAGLAMRRSFAKNIRIPQTITGASSHYIYLSARESGRETAFCADSVITYRLAATLKDYLLQTNRGSGDSAVLKERFPTLYRTAYAIPRSWKLATICKLLIYNPISTIIGLLFMLIVPMLNTDIKASDSHGGWQTAKSTKKL